MKRILVVDDEPSLLCVLHLRAKLNQGGRPDLIQAIRGVGYLLSPNEHPGEPVG